MANKGKRTFTEFLWKVYGITYSDYENLNDLQKKAAELDYISRYGAPIKWF